MAVTVSEDLTELANADSSSEAWVGINNPDPGSSAFQNQNFRQGTNAVAIRVDNAEKGLAFNNGSGIDFRDASGNYGHFMIWHNVASPGGLQAVASGGISMVASSSADPDSGNTGEWYWGGTDTYKLDQGWYKTCVWVAHALDVETGTLNLDSIQSFGVQWDMNDILGNTPNCACDSLEYIIVAPLGLPSGYTMTGGTPAGTFEDFRVYEEDTAVNRQGVVVTRPWEDVKGAVFVNMRLTLGSSATALTFEDKTGVAIVFDDQHLARADWLGITLNLENSSTDIDIASMVLKSGGKTNNPHSSTPNLGDLVALGETATAGALLDVCTLARLRRLRLNGKATVQNSTIDGCGQITVSNSAYDGDMRLPGTDEYMDTTTNITLNSGAGAVDFEVIIHVQLDDWTPGSNEYLVSQYGGSAATGTFRWRVNSSGQQVLIVSDGTTETTLTGSAMRQLTLDGIRRWLRVQYDVSTGGANFFESFDPPDTPAADVNWTAAGTPTGTARNLPNISRPILVGAAHDAIPFGFMTGNVRYAELWMDGFEAPGAGHGNLIFRLDLRNGPDFTGTPSVRSDDFDTSISWEEQGTAPVYTTGDNNSTAADLDGSTILNSTSESALVWNVNADPNGELDNMSFTSAGTGHAIEFGPNTPSSVTLTSHTYSGYAATDGSTGNETIYNNSNKAITINYNGNKPTIRNGTGASTSIVNAVTVKVTAKDAADLTVVEGCRVLLTAATGGDLPYEDSVSITRSGATATVTHTSHGFSTSDKVQIKGATEQEYNGIFSITVTGANTYTYTVTGTPDTPATGSPVATAVILDGTTNASGVIEVTNFNYTSDQPVEGKVRKGTVTPRYKNSPLTDSILSSGYAVTSFMVLDE